MANATKRTPTSKRWTAIYTGEDGTTKKAAGFTDKAETVRLARRLEDEARKRRLGLVDESAERMAGHARRPIAEHVEAYKAHLESKGNTPGHVRRTLSFIGGAIEACEWATLADLDAPRLAGRLASMGDRGLSPRARNARLRAVKAFTSWLVAEHRLRSDPLSSLRPARESDDKRIVRRALSPDEVAELLGYVESAGDLVTIPKRYKHKGETRTGSRNIRVPNRAALYRLMLGTGFRVSEAASVRGADFSLDADPPVVRVRAGYTKNRKPVEQPIRRDLADALRPLVARTGREALVWPKLPANLAPVVVADLKAARAAWIARGGDEDSDFLRAVDREGRRVDAHAFRHTYCSMLARSSAPVRVVQELARHSDPRLTMNTYAHVRLADAAGAMESLPPMAKMGTEWAQSDRPHGQSLSENSRETAAHAETDDAQNHRENKAKRSQEHGMSGVVSKWRCPDSNRGPRVYESLALTN